MLNTHISNCHCIIFVLLKKYLLLTIKYVVFFLLWVEIKTNIELRSLSSFEKWCYFTNHFYSWSDWIIIIADNIKIMSLLECYVIR